MVTYVKEFENYVLSESNEEVLRSITPGSQADIFVQIISKLKSIDLFNPDANIPDELNKMISRCKDKLTENAFKEMRLLVLLKEFDLKTTDSNRKQGIIEEIKNLFYEHINFSSYRKPQNIKEFNQNQNVNTMVQDSDPRLYTLDSSIFDTSLIVEEYLKNPDNPSILQKLDSNYFLKIVDLTKMPEVFFKQWIIDRNFQIPFYEISDEVLIKVAKFIDENSNRNKYAVDISEIVKSMTADQISKFSEMITNQYLDKNELVNNIITKKYYSELKLCENELEKREIYLSIYQLIKEKSSKFNALKANVLLEILKKGLTLKSFNDDLDLFKEYLRNPCTANNKIYKANESKLLELKNQKRYNICNQNYTTDENSIISSYLSYYFLFTNLQIKEFQDYLQYDYLQREYYTARILRCENSDNNSDNIEYIKLFSKQKYEELVKMVQITICSHNKSQFDLKEEINIEVDLKNVQTLFVKIFEINTINYYQSKASVSPIENSIINLEGLITTNEETFSFNSIPQKLNRRKFEFDKNKIPMKRGVYIIEFIGGGLSSRAMIKKGSLSLVTRETSQGICLFILNENSEVCKSESTGVLYRDNFYSCDLSNGRILIPYMKQQSTAASPCILIHEDFADFAILETKEERYELKGTFHINHESIITGNNTKIFFKPFLFINGRLTKSEYLKSSKITAKLTKIENGETIPISSIFDNFDLTVNKNKDIEFELQIPPKLVSIDLTYEASVAIKSGERDEKLKYSQNINMISQQDDTNFVKFFLRKLNSHYFLSLLGKNGEPKADVSVNLTFKHSYVNKEYYKVLQTNTQGETFLGKLPLIERFTASTNYFGRNIESKWILPQRTAISYPSSIDILSDETIQLPLHTSIDNYDKNQKSLFSLIKATEYNEVICDLTSSSSIQLNVINEDENKFNLIISNLNIGKYFLYLRENSCNENKRIEINVHSGKFWESKNFIITKNKIIENSQHRYPVYIKDIKISSDNLLIKLSNTNKSCRVHLFTHQFLNNDIGEFSSNIKNIINGGKFKSVHSFNNSWKNIFMSNKILNDEIQYVINRKYVERYLGNSLEKPSLLVKRQFVRDTTTEMEVLDEGTEYIQELKSKEDKLMEREMGKRRLQKINEKNLCNTFSDFHNFLAYSPVTMINLIPNENGEIEIKNLNLSNFSHLQIVVFNEKSFYQEFLSVNSNPIPINKKNLSLVSNLCWDKTYSEIRKTELFHKNDEIHITDIASAGFKIIDSLEKIVNYQILANSNLQTEWDKFSFLIKFSELSALEQNSKYSNFFSHEINLYLNFKYPDLFIKYVKPALKFKFEKTFIDYFLLNDEENLKKYNNSAGIENLNALERCLLISYLVSQGFEDQARSIRNSMIALVDKNELNTENLKKLFGIMMNMKVADNNKNVFNNFAEMSYSCQAVPRCEKKVMMCENFMSMDEGGLGHGATFCKKEVEDDQEDLFEQCEELKESEIELMNTKNNLYKTPGSSKEYQETHYYHPWSAINFTNFWVDFATHLIDSKSSSISNFLSKNIILPVQNISELIFMLAIIDLPVLPLSHTFNRKEGMSLQIISSSNLILFTKEITEAAVKLNTNILIAQNISEYANENNTQHNSEITKGNYLVNKIYVHETIVTNISARKMTFELLIQIPNGSVPVMNSEYTRTLTLSLDKFNTTNFITYFYFPEVTGVFAQYPPNAAIDGRVISIAEKIIYNVLNSYSYNIQAKESLEDVLLGGNKQDVLEFLRSNNSKLDLTKIYWLLKDKEFYTEITRILISKGIYDNVVWSFSLFHNDEIILKEFLERDKIIKSALGPQFTSSLIKIDEVDNSDIHNHLDYHPIFNARVHRLGRNTNTFIMNRELKETYEKFILYLMRLRPEEYTAKCNLRLCYYLILQDRIEEALKLFSKINTIEFNENTNISMMIQYDYIAAYLDFSVGYPHFKLAHEICGKYKNFPLLYWREMFEEIEDQIFEYEGKENFDDIEMLIDEDKRKKQIVKNVINTLPTLSFCVENKSLQIQHSNVKTITIKFYLIDLEILFSRTPFIKSNTEDFSFVQPNYTKEISIHGGVNTKEELLNFPIPGEFLSKNLFIEVSSIDKKAFETYFSTLLKVTISENLGEIKVTDNKLKPLSKVYVKCYALMKDTGSVKFYKDGYTDLRGKFNYILLNTDQLKNVKAFSVFIMHDEMGSIIKECSPPNNIRMDSVNSDYDNYQNYRQTVKEIWKSKKK